MSSSFDAKVGGTGPLQSTPQTSTSAGTGADLKATQPVTSNTNAPALTHPVNTSVINENASVGLIGRPALGEASGSNTKDREIYQQLMQKCDAPLSQEGITMTEKAYAAAISDDKCKEYLSDHSKEWPDEVIGNRTQSSVTMLVSEEKVQAHKNWVECEKYSRKVALEDKNKDTPFDCRVVGHEFHRRLGEGLLNNGKPTGEFRNDEISSGEDEYLPPSCIEEAMDDFNVWVNEGLAKCKADPASNNPIEFAGRAYQKFETIHPYPDGNGRTGRMIMDYLLMRLDLPPACLGNNEKVAIYIGNSRRSMPIDDVMDFVSDGVKKTMELIQDE